MAIMLLRGLLKGIDTKTVGLSFERDPLVEPHVRIIQALLWDRGHLGRSEDRRCEFFQGAQLLRRMPRA